MFPRRKFSETELQTPIVETFWRWPPSATGSYESKQIQDMSAGWGEGMGFDATTSLITENNRLISGRAPAECFSLNAFECSCPEMMCGSKTSGSIPSEPLCRSHKLISASQVGPHRFACLGRVRGPPGTLLHYYFCSFPAHFPP